MSISGILSPFRPAVAFWKGAEPADGGEKTARRSISACDNSAYLWKSCRIKLPGPVVHNDLRRSLYLGFNLRGDVVDVEILFIAQNDDGITGSVVLARTRGC
jgi:hypothetical protein